MNWNRQAFIERTTLELYQKSNMLGSLLMTKQVAEDAARQAVALADAIEGQLGPASITVPAKPKDQPPSKNPKLARGQVWANGKGSLCFIHDHDFDAPDPELSRTFSDGSGARLEPPTQADMEMGRFGWHCVYDPAEPAAPATPKDKGLVDIMDGQVWLYDVGKPYPCEPDWVSGGVFKVIKEPGSGVFKRRWAFSEDQGTPHDIHPDDLAKMRRQDGYTLLYTPV